MQTSSPSDLSLKLLNLNNCITLRLNGISMYPLLKAGDVATIEKCNVDSLKRGDIAVFKSENKWIVHRYFKKELIDNTYLITTKGDSRMWIDPPFLEDKFIGKMTSFRRRERVFNLSSNFYSILGSIIVNTSRLNTLFFVFNRKFWERMQ